MTWRCQMSMDSESPEFAASFRCWLPRHHEVVISHHWGAFAFVHRDDDAPEPDPIQHWIHYHPSLGQVAVTKVYEPDYLDDLPVEQLAAIVPVTCQYLIDGGWPHDDHPLYMKEAMPNRPDRPATP